MATVTAPQAQLLVRSNTALSVHRHKPLLFKTGTLSLLSPPPPRSLSLKLRFTKPYHPVLKVSSSTSTPTLSSNLPSSSSSSSSSSSRSLLSDSTRTVSSLLAGLLSVSQLFMNAIDSMSSRIRATMSANPTPEELAKIRTLKQTLVFSIGPLFFASSSLSSPLMVVAAGMVRWLEIYSSLLFVRVLLSWFPNLPWDKQPLSAIRDLSDPYLNLFRNIIPPVFNSLDISPFFAFTSLGILTMLLKINRAA